MIELHITSLWVGGVFGFLFGMAIAYFSCWAVERQCNDRFSDGWDAGVKYGKKFSAEMEAKE